MSPKEKKLVETVPLMHCGNRAEFKQRLQWLSEGMLKNHLEGVVNYTPDQSEIDTYRRFKKVVTFRKARRLRADMQDYENQRYIGHLLDVGVFDTLNASSPTRYTFRGEALDAPDYMPAGSMVTSVLDGYFDRSTIERGVSLQEQQAIWARLDALMDES